MSITDLDFMILDAIQKIRNSFLDSFFATITHLGDSGILAILIAILLIFGMKKKYRQTGISLAFALVIAFVLGNLILKNVIARPRPCWVRESIGLIAVPKDYSFPSGHTHVSVLLAVVLWHENRKWGIAAGCLASAGRVFPDVSVCTLSHGYSGRGSVRRFCRMGRYPCQ